MPTGGQTATARRWPQSKTRSTARRCSYWSPPTTSSAKERWNGCWRPVSRPYSSIQHPDQPTWAEGTRVRVVDGAVVAFSKHLEEPAIDCGAFLLPPEVFDRQRQAATEGHHSLAGAVTRLAQTRPLRAVALPAGCWWQDVDTPQDARAARVALRRSLGKDTDGPVSRLLNRPLSTRLSMVLAPLRPAPDLVSLIAFTFGVAGAVLLAAGQGPAGGLLVHASSVADEVDGELAPPPVGSRPGRLELAGQAGR